MKKTIILFVMAVLLLPGGLVFAQNNHDFVDLGLPSGTLWATCNVGADTPEGYGFYIAWGETQAKDQYDWSTYKHNYFDEKNELFLNLSKYNTYGGYGKVDALTTLQSEDDAATVNWGEEWCVPTADQWMELYQNTTSVWTNREGVKGRLFTGANGNSIFVPAAGICMEGDLRGVGSDGYYWSSSLEADGPNSARYFLLLDDKCQMNYLYRFYGQSIRPVRAATPK